MTTYTPQTDACPHCGSKADPNGDPKGEWECDSWAVPTGIRQSRVCKARAELKASKAEVERLDQMVEWFIENAPHFTLAQFNEHQRTLNPTDK